VFVRFRTLPGPFCRDCGVAVGRESMAGTLVWGWWGIAAPVAAFMLVGNALLLRKLERLGPPGPPAAGSATLRPGRPLTSRPQIAGVLVPVAILAFLIVLWSRGA
jgi:hypothetical protein